MRRTLALLLGGTLVLAMGLTVWVRTGNRVMSAPREQCGVCHSQVRGIEASHSTVPCSGCHLGVSSSTVARVAHTGLVQLPGNFDDMERTCGAAGCHPSVPARLRANIMNTMNGVVSVDRWVFGEQATPTAVTPVQQLGHSRADEHLRTLCASCHLSAQKREPGPPTERSRGGGCLACHLRATSRTTFADGGDPAAAFTHATLTVTPEPISCFGCHSRSGRSSLNFEGWREVESADAGVPVRHLDDGRLVAKTLADVHFERGLTCVDCHGSWEVMGDGRPALHREDQASIACTDCHLVGPPSTVSFERLDAESSAIARLEGTAAPGREFLRSAAGGFPLVNAWVTDAGVTVVGKRSGKVLLATTPTAACLATEHRRLSCGSCHDAWAPQCISCHTRFEADGGAIDLLDDTQTRGEWVEHGDEALAEPASLGVRLLADGGQRFETFVPGMISTFDDGSTHRFRRLFAPLFAHTVRREVRSCQSCHRSSLALGFGRGELRPEPRGQWRFIPAREPDPGDGLPADAWIRPFSSLGSEATSRTDTRPLSATEQRRILAAPVDPPIRR
jgi:hypothetical protein